MDVQQWQRGTNTSLRLPWNRFLGSIKVLKIPPLFVLLRSSSFFLLLSTGISRVRSASIFLICGINRLRFASFFRICGINRLRFASFFRICGINRLRFASFFLICGINRLRFASICLICEINGILRCRTAGFASLRSLQVLELAGSFRFDIENEVKIEASFRLRFDIVANTRRGFCQLSIDLLATSLCVCQNEF